MKSNTIYLDYQATTPCEDRVVKSMIPYFTGEFGNPHSKDHAFGFKAAHAVDDARKKVADLIGANSKEIIFTSGATESNNLAIKGLARFYKEKKNHLITLQTEHKCVLNSMRALRNHGFDVTFLKVQKNGLVDIDLLAKSITNKTLLVSIMMVHNEIGVIQPISEIGKICKEKGVFFHTDAAQAYGKIPIDVNKMNIDMLSISGHKIYGPKGVGALYIRRHGLNRVKMVPLFDGGGQENGFRSGTLSPALCVGLGIATDIAKERMKKDYKHIKSLSDFFYKKITNALPKVYLNGDFKHRFPGNLNLSFTGVEGEGLMYALKGIAISSGSACNSDSLEGSYVLAALGVSAENAHTSLRIGIGRYTTKLDIEKSAEMIINQVIKLRGISPIWEMMEEGIDISKIQWASH